MKKYIICLIAVTLLVVSLLIAMLEVFISIAEKQATDNAEYCAARIEDKLAETLDLLIALSNTDVIQGQELTYKEKAAALTRISEQFGYMMIRVLDKDLWVYNETVSGNGASSNLSERAYLQAVKSTLTPQITDLFLAGADGKTKNFTVAVPIVTDSVFQGALFAAIYDSDFTRILEAKQSFLLNSQSEYMLGVEAEKLGQKLENELNDVVLLSTSIEECLDKINNKDGKSFMFLGLSKLHPVVYAYSNIANSNWSVICKVSFADVLADNLFMYITFILSFSGMLAIHALLVLFRPRVLAFFAPKKEADNTPPD